MVMSTASGVDGALQRVLADRVDLFLAVDVAVDVPLIPRVAEALVEGLEHLFASVVVAFQAPRAMATGQDVGAVGKLLLVDRA